MEEVKAEDIKTDMIEQAELLAKRIEESNKKSEELLKKQEQILARQILGGRSNMNVAPVIDEEKAERDRINKILAGTGLKI